MILFLILISILNGYILHASFMTGLFFIFISSIICIRKTASVLFLGFHLGVTAIIAMAVFILPETAGEEEIAGFQITGYKYYQEEIHHTVSYDRKQYDLYLDSGERLPIGHVCPGPFEVALPDAQRNFIKADDALAMKVNGTSGRIYLDTLDIEACGAGERSAAMRLAEVRDAYILNTLAKTTHDYKYDMLTLSIGNKSYITSEFFDALQKLGIYHLYVISGTHVAFVAAILFFVLRRMRLPIHIIKIVMIIALVMFLCLNFFSPSVFRAVFMTVALLVTSFTRRKPYLAVISLSAIVQIAMNPWVVYHAGFQLSYVTTYLILLSRSHWMNYGFFTQLLGITAVAEISTLVILLEQFNELSVSGIVMNLFFVPLFTFLIFPMVILFNVMSLADIPAVMDHLYMVIFSTMKDMMFFLAGSMKHRFAVPNMNAFWLILLITLSYMMTVSLCLKQFRHLAVLACCFIASIFMLMRVNGDDFTVTMVDVGQGDAFVIEDHRNGVNLLVDTGGRFYHTDTGRRLSDRTVLPYLKESGIDRIDMMVLSHFDLDHVGESHHIIDKVEVKNVLINPEDPAFMEWHKDLPEKFEGRLVDGSVIQELSIGSIGISRLSRSDGETVEDSNGNSLILKVEMGAYSFLFTGDADIEMEEALIAEHGRIEADVLKLAHHGSDTSTGDYFVSNSKFKYGMISAGVGNRYGHPHAEVVERMEGVRLFDTSKHGMVRFRIDGDRMCVEAKLDPRLDHCIKKES